MKKDILTLIDLNKEDFECFFNRAFELKKRHKQGIVETSLAGKTLGLVFDKPSTRTRLSFETAMAQLGGTAIFIAASDTQMARNEPVKDTARALSRYLDGLAIRTFSQDLLAEFAKYSSISVINALTDLYHPCQVLSDLMTVIEFKKGYKGLKMVWVGDGNNVSHSWINAASVLGLNLVLACPQEYLPDRAILDAAIEKGSGSIEITSDPFAAAAHADVIYTDVWASMGKESESVLRKQVFKSFQVNQDLLKEASKEVIVMHCLPAHRGEEISEAVLEGPCSVIWEQAENKLHMHKAILEILISNRSMTNS